MDERKKILLGNKDILSRKIKDFYIDINLSKDSKEIVPYKYDNIFDLTRFYNQERNESRNFIIYGTLDSYSWDCNNLKIDVYQSPGLNHSDLLCTSLSKHIVNKNMPFKNIYNKLRGRYIIDNIPTTFNGCSVYLKITTPTTSYVLEQQLIFTTLTLSSSGEKVIEQLEYGLDEAVTDCDGNIIQVSNDFDFFYNKHWIKKDIFIPDLRTKWIGNPNDVYCELDSLGYNTGKLQYNTVMEVYEINNEPTGNIMDNSGVNVVSGVDDLIACPLPVGVYELKVIVLPAGSGTAVLTPQRLNNLYAPNQTVHVSIIPNPCYEFVGITNIETSQSMTTNGIDVLMDGNQEFRATCEKEKYTLSIEINVDTTYLNGYTESSTEAEEVVVKINNESYFATSNVIFNCDDHVSIQSIKTLYRYTTVDNTTVSQMLKSVYLDNVLLSSPYVYGFNISGNTTLRLHYSGEEEVGGVKPLPNDNV